MTAAARLPNVVAWGIGALVAITVLLEPHGVRANQVTAPLYISGSDGVWERLPPFTTTNHSAIYDPIRNRMVVFGGGSPTLKNDTWQLTLSGSTAWTLLQASGPPTPPVGHAAVYEPVRDRMLVIGGWDGSSVNEVWALPLSDGAAWSQIGTASGSPPARSEHGAVYDPVRDRVIVFAGVVAGVPKNDVWELSLAGTPDWTQLAPSGTPPVPRYGHTTVYDPIRDRLIVFGGRQPVLGSGFNDVWELRLADTPTWTRLSPAGVAPSGREQATAIYDSLRNRMVVFGGSFNNGAITFIYNDVWALSLGATPAWSKLTPQGILPPERSDHTAVYDRTGDRMIAFGGSDNVAWALQFSPSLGWYEITPPAVRNSATLILDPLRNRMLLFGGFGVNNDTWALALTDAPSWSRLVTSGVAPSRRYGHGAVYDPGGDRMIVFGGANENLFLFNDTRVLQLSATPAWATLVTTGVPPTARLYHTATYDPLRHRVIVYGGYDGSVRGDLWVLSLSGTPAWSPLNPSGTPPAPRLNHTAIYDPIRDRLVIFGGRDFGGNIFNDTWELALSGAPTWTPLAPEGIPPTPQDGHAAIYDSFNDRMVITGNLPAPMALDLESPAWSQLSTSGGPLFPYLHTAAYDPAHFRMILFAEGDTWQLSWADAASVLRSVASIGFELSGVYPNPTAGRATIEYSLASTAQVRIGLYDLQGRLVDTVVDEMRTSGRHQVVWHIGGRGSMSPRMYFVRMNVAGRQATRPIVLVN